MTSWELHFDDAAAWRMVGIAPMIGGVSQQHWAFSKRFAKVQ